MTVYWQSRICIKHVRPPQCQVTADWNPCSNKINVSKLSKKAVVKISLKLYASSSGGPNKESHHIKVWLKKKNLLSFQGHLKKSVLHGNHVKNDKQKFDRDSNVPEKTLLTLENGSNFQFRNIFGCSFCISNKNIITFLPKLGKGLWQKSSKVLLFW